MHLNLFCYSSGVVVQNWTGLCKLALQGMMDMVKIFVGTVLTEEKYVFNVCL